MYLGAKILNICQNIALYAIKIAKKIFFYTNLLYIHHKILGTYRILIMSQKGNNSDNL